MTESLFSPAEWLRYTRHIQLPQVGAKGQTRLKQAHVLIVGLGGLGSPVALYLAAAGIGRMTLMDGDTVDLTNLQRQILFTENDIGQAKVACAKSRLLQLNSHCRIDTFSRYFNAGDDTLIDDVDLVIDCTDNFATRYAINDACLKAGKPWIYASIFQFSGQCAVFVPEHACFRCVFPAPPEDAVDCNSAGVIGVLPGLLGLIQANEAIKYLSGLPTSLTNQLLLFDALKLQQQKIKLATDPTCICQTKTMEAGKHPHADAATGCIAGQTLAENELSVTIDAFNKHRNEVHIHVVDVREDDERLAFHIGGEHCPLATLLSQAAPPAWQAPNEVYVLCQSGVRSAKAAAYLREQGISAYSVDGGIYAWLKQAHEARE